MYLLPNAGADIGDDDEANDEQDMRRCGAHIIG